MSQERQQLPADPGRFIAERIKEFVLTSPSSRLPFMDDYFMWGEPLVGFAAGGDPIFTEYKSVIAPGHLTPREALARAYNKDLEDMPERLSVISWILPIARETGKSNRAETRVPSRLWSHTRWYGEKSNDALRAHVVGLLTGLGYLAAAPVSQPYFKSFSNERGPYSNWSERHMAYAAGLGTFSLSDGLITECGIAHRCGSVVTSLELPASRRAAASHLSNCLFYAGVKCTACIDRCPAGAITDKGHDKIVCQQYQRGIGRPAVNGVYDNDNSVVGCGFCQTKVPCEFHNPTKKLKKQAV